MAKKKVTKKALVPELRFPEFQRHAVWNEGTLSDLASPVKTRAKNVHGDDVLTLSAEQGIVRQTDYFGKQIAGKNLDRYLKIRRDDFVYNDRVTSASRFGTIRRLKDYSAGAVSPIYKCFRFQSTGTPEFWDQYFEAGAHESDLGEHVNEGARAGRFNISVDTLLSITVRYPSADEQHKIADCLGSLDGLIAAHSAKLDALQDHKKGLLQQLFPAKGETVPALRFPEYRKEGKWTKKKLGSICKIQRGRFSHRPRNDPKFFGGPYPFIQTGDVVRSNGGPVEASQSLNEEGLRVSKLFKPTIVLVTIAANIGDTGLLTCDACFTDSVVGLIPDSQTDPRFLELVVRGQKPRLNDVAAQAAQKNINNEILADLDLMLPKLAEQQEIADCLASLDTLIVDQFNTIEALISHKKGLMQKLFPNPELVRA